MTVAASPARLPARATDEEGSILPLIAVFGAVAIALVLVVACATSLYLDRKRLYTIADAAALAGAESFPLDRIAASGSAHPVLEEREVLLAARDSVAQAGSTIEAVELERAGTPDGRTAEVTVRGLWRPPIPLPFVPDGVPIAVTATARAVFR